MNTAAYEIVDTYLELIEQHARVALKKIKRPRRYTLEDLVQEGVVVFLFTKKEYVDRGATFKTILIKRLRGHFASLVKRTYRIKEENRIFLGQRDPRAAGTIKNGKIVPELDIGSGPFEIACLSFTIENFTKEEIDYVNAMLSHTHISKRSRRKVVRETLEMSYGREVKVRRSIGVKMKK